MLIVLDEDNYETEVEHYTCPHHQSNPYDVSYAGCGCYSSYSRVRKSRESRFKSGSRPDNRSGD